METLPKQSSGLVTKNQQPPVHDFSPLAALSVSTSCFKLHHLKFQQPQKRLSGVARNIRIFPAALHHISSFPQFQHANYLLVCLHVQRAQLQRFNGCYENSKMKDALCVCATLGVELTLDKVHWGWFKWPLDVTIASSMAIKTWSEWDGGIAQHPAPLPPTRNAPAWSTRMSEMTLQRLVFTTQKFIMKVKHTTQKVAKAIL